MAIQENAGVNSVAFRHHSGAEVRAGLLRVNRYVVAFEVYSPSLGLCLSDVLTEFRIVAGERTLYSGRAVVTAIVNTGPMLVCEAALDDAGFRTASLGFENGSGHGESSFRDFVRQWQGVAKILPEFKLVTADMASFLWDLRVWLEQIELEIRLAPSGPRSEMERAAVDSIASEMVPAFNELHERLESVSSRIDPELRPTHQNFCRRQLHALTMCSPFAFRTFHKPLGYAGDYEMVNMILRDPFQGGSTYAKVVNHWFLRQWPATAHRNRIVYLRQILEQECLRGACSGRTIRILNLGCGPAQEICQFMEQSPASDFADFMLWDFNDETLHFASNKLEQVRREQHRRTGLTFQKRSVQQLIKESARVGTGRAPQTRYDLIYCAGLFDYLSERTCKQLMNLFYEWLAPGGLLVATNVDDCKPFRHMLEFVLDWHLVYRNTARAEALMPDASLPEDRTVKRDVTGVNVFMEARRPLYD